MTEARNLISVVIPAYNRADKIEASIKSVQAQTYKDWEIVVSDDGSKDSTKEVVERLIKSDKRIRLVSRETNAGAQAARNAGIKAAQGEWIAFLDSDDQFLPESLELRMNIALKEHVDVVHSDAFIQHQGKPLEQYHVPAWKGNIYRKILVKEGPMFPALLIKKSALERIGYLDENIRSYQEWDTCIRLAKHYEFGFEPQPTFVYDYRTSNAISRDFIRAGIGYEQSLAKHWKDMLLYNGTGALAYHYDVAAQWYQKGNDLVNYKRCASRAGLFKVLSPIRILRKIKHVIFRNGKNNG